MVSHEEKVALGVLGIGAAALVLYLLLRPTATVQAGTSIVPVGITSGSDNPATITVPAADAGSLNFPGITIPGLTNTLPNLTQTNVTTGAAQCSCPGIGLNQAFYGSPADQAAAMAPTILSLFPPGGTSGTIGGSDIAVQNSSAAAAPSPAVSLSGAASSAVKWIQNFTSGIAVPQGTVAVPQGTIAVPIATADTSTATPGAIPYV